MTTKMKFTVLLTIIPLIFASCQSGSTEKEKESAGTTAKKAETIPVGLDVGNLAPDMEYMSPDGKPIKLSSLRGKIVLIDFWAAWCPPCRMENPNIVSTYHTYKNQKFKSGNGFTVYGVSLDQDKNQWLEAIKKDGLEWDSHVSDLKGWKSVPAAMYQVRGIPASWLIDGEGVIVARNLRGAALGAELEKLK